MIDPVYSPVTGMRKVDDDRGVWSTVGISALWHLDA